MPGLFSRIGAALSGSGQDEKLASRIEEFSNGYVVQSEVPRTLGLRHEEVALLESILAEKLYRAYCSEHLKKDPTEKTLARFAQSIEERRARHGVAADVQARLEAAFRDVADDLVDVARQRQKIQLGFDSVDGLTESIVSARIGLRAPEVRAARRGGAQ